MHACTRRQAVTAHSSAQRDVKGGGSSGASREGGGVFPEVGDLICGSALISRSRRRMMEGCLISRAGLIGRGTVERRGV